jgi:hypothetical protein
MKKFKRGYEYESRNNQEIRNLFADILSILVFSKKSKKFDKLPIINDKELSHQYILHKIKSKDMELIEKIIDDEDDREIKIAVNEIAYHLKYGKFDYILYWYLWIEKLYKFRKKNKLPLKCKKREIKNIDIKFYDDWIWILWDIIYFQLELIMNNKLLNEINALFYMYKWKYSNATKNKKQYLLFFALLLIKENYNQNLNWKIPLIDKYEYRIQTCCNINQLYKLKKIDEITKTIEDNLIKEDKLEYKKISEITKKQPQIKIKTSTNFNSKPIKINKNNDEHEKYYSILMQKLNFFNQFIYHKKNNIDNNIDNNINDNNLINDEINFDEFSYIKYIKF